MKDRLVTAAIVPAILDLAIKRRINVESVFGRAELDPALLNQAGNFISVEQLIQLFDAAYESMNMPSFGLLLGESVHYHSLDLMGQLIATSRNLQQALDELLRFKDLVVPHVEFSLQISGPDAVFDFSVDSSLVKRNLTVHQDVVASTMISISRAIVPEGVNIKEVYFTHPDPGYHEDYERIFQAPVKFSCARNELVFDKDALNTRLLTSYPEYHSGVRTLVQQKLRSIESQQSLSNKVSYYISASLGLKPTHLEKVAEHFNMTPRTLQRKLKQEATSFVQLRDACRHARALRDLGDSSIEVEALAEMLGFSDTSNFYHAFKRWQGVSPGAYRRQALADKEG